MDQVEYPIIWKHLMIMLIGEYGVPPNKAFAQARKLIKSCRRYGMDIVGSTWVHEPPKEAVRRDPWEKAIEWLAETEEAGRTPWYPES